MNRKKTQGEKDSVIAVLILLILLFLYFKQKSWIYTTLAVAVISLLSSRVAFYIHKVWTMLSEIVGRISGAVILTLVFFIIVIPTALLKGWFGRKDILLNGRKLNSVFHHRNHKYTRADMENPW